MYSQGATKPQRSGGGEQINNTLDGLVRRGPILITTIEI
jgi:hypothetical protein